MSVRKSSCALLAIAALVLAGCGGGGTTATTPEPTPEPKTDPVTPPAPKPATPATPEKTPAEKVSDLLASTVEERTKALDARAAADMGLKDAKEANAELSSSPAVKLMGDSSEAQKKAQAILDAKAKVDTALSDAEAALTALKKAKEDADKLPDGTTNLDKLKTSITAAITAVTSHRDYVKGIKDAKGTGSLAAQVARVPGGKAADVAAQVAVTIEKAGTNYIGKSTTDFPMNTGGKASVVTYATQPDSFPDSNDLYRLSRVVKMDDAPANAKTWEEVVGTDKIVGRAISSSGDDGFRRMAPFKGMDAGTIETSPAPKLAGQGEAYEYLGITGVLYCLEQRCPVTNGKLGDGWYWTVPPESKYKHWVMESNGNYKEFTDYAHYGYWIKGADDEAIVRNANGIFTFGLPHNDRASSTRFSSAAAAGLTTSTTIPGNNTAKYSGKALGISVVTKDSKAIKSGQFTADVELTATFAASPTVTGTIKNFKGNAVGNWTLTLESATLLHTNLTAMTHFGLTDDGNDATPTTSHKGRWHARAYGGSTTTRPTGITGDFYALFSDGRAMGGYATRKD